MKKNLTTKELVKSGAVVVGNFNGINLNETGDVTKEGFYFISAPASSVVYMTHVGNQQRKRGFDETMIRLRKPRTGQAKDVHDYLMTGKTVKLYFLKYSQARHLLGIEEYGQMNNGHELTGKIRNKFIIHGRMVS